MNSNPADKIPKNKSRHSYLETILNNVSSAELSFDSRRKKNILVRIAAIKLYSRTTKPAKHKRKRDSGYELTPRTSQIVKRL